MYFNPHCNLDPRFGCCPRHYSLNVTYDYNMIVDHTGFLSYDNETMPCFLHDGKGLRYILLSTPWSPTPYMIPINAVVHNHKKDLHRTTYPYCNQFSLSLVHPEARNNAGLWALWYLPQFVSIISHIKTVN